MATASGSSKWIRDLRLFCKVAIKGRYMKIINIFIKTAEERNKIWKFKT